MAVGEEEQEATIVSEESSMVVEQTLAPTSAAVEVEAQPSNETTIQSNAQAEPATESTCNNINNNNNNNAEPSSDDANSKSLEAAIDFFNKGTTAFKAHDYGEAADCFSRALEIRVSHYGELASECLTGYYQYGRSLLYKAQEEADPLGSVPKKDKDDGDDDSKLDSDKDNDGSVKSKAAESSTASVSSNTDDNGKVVSNQESAADGDASGVKDQEEEGDESGDDEDLAEADEDETDLDLAWKMLDVARAIAEKHKGDTMDKVDVLSALAEVALEREDIETSLSDYKKALCILERLVEQDSRHLAELNFRICLCLEVGSQPQEAIVYCQRALSICKSRLQRLTNEIKDSSESGVSSTVSELDDSVQQSSNDSQNNKSTTGKEAEIETLNDLSGELEKKLEDLQQLAVNPKSILSEILGMMSAKAKAAEKSETPAETNSSRFATATAGSSGAFDSPTVSTAHTNGAAVTHLGVVGRGVKRVLMSTGSSPVKKPALDQSSADKDDNTQ